MSLRRLSRRFEGVSGSWKDLLWVQPDRDESWKGSGLRLRGGEFLLHACGWQ